MQISFSLSCRRLQAIVKEWKMNEELKTNYHLWNLREGIPQLSIRWWQFIHHCLMSFYMSNLKWTITDYQPQQLQIHNNQIKLIYRQLCVCSPLKNYKFDLYMIITAKLICLFLGNQIKSLQTDSQLQSQVYAYLIQTLLGIKVQKNSYVVILAGHLQKKNKKEGTKSCFQSKDQVEGKSKGKMISTISTVPRKSTLQSMSTFYSKFKRQTKQSLLQTIQNYQHRISLDQFRLKLKDTLYVQPPKKSVITKYSLEQLKMQETQNKPEQKLKFKNIFFKKQKNIHLKKEIKSTQLSEAMSLNNNLKLTQVKTFSIHLSSSNNKENHVQKPKCSFYQSLQKINNPPFKSLQKEAFTKDWQKLMKQMKQKLYKRQGRQIKKQRYQNCAFPSIKKRVFVQQKTDKNDDSYCEKDPQKQLEKQKKRTFRALDIKNSPNLSVYVPEQRKSQIILTLNRNSVKLKL